MRKINPRVVVELLGLALIIIATSLVQPIAGLMLAGIILVLEANYGDAAASTDEEE